MESGWLRIGVFVLAFGVAGPAAAQEISADGRSVVGETTILDRLVRALDPDRVLVGLSGDELKLWGERLYPEEGPLHNRAAHRLGARILTNRFGAVAATSLGIANEIFEAYNLRHTGHPVISTERFDLGDLAANTRGLVDAYALNLNTPWGFFRLLEAVRGQSARGSATLTPDVRVPPAHSPQIDTRARQTDAPGTSWE